MTFLKNTIQPLFPEEYDPTTNLLKNDPVTVLLKKASGGYTERFYRILPLVGVYPSMLSTPMYVNCNNHCVIVRIAAHGLRCTCMVACK